MRALALLLALAACHGKGDDTDVPALGSCDPLDPSLCALPFPSSFYLRDDPTTATGYRVHFADDSLPKNIDDVQMNPQYWNEKDGFSTGGPFLTWFDGTSLDGVVGHGNIEDYSAPDAKIVVVDATTGERVPVWAELDMSAPDDAHRLLMIYPASPLEHARRYVVGIRGLTKTSGGSVDVSDAFAALRDGTTTGDVDVDSRQQHFDDDVFPVLENAGVPRGDLQLAWDFVTVSRENSLGRMEAIRQDGLDRIGADGPPYTITSVEDGDCTTDTIARTIEGTMTVPLYTETDAPGTLLTRDDDGMPYYNGDTEVEWLVRVPCSVAQQPKPSPILQYGHGLLGDKSEAKTGWLSSFANDSGYVVLATTWKGMSTEDAPRIALTITQDPSGFVMVPERSHQGFFETMAALRLLKGRLAADPALQFPDREGTMVSVVDPTRAFYDGNSQGGIMGGAYLAMSPDLDKGVLGVPGMPYSLLLFRSHDFDDFFKLFKAKFDDHRQITLILGLMEQLWEPAEALGWAYDMNRDVHDGIPAKQVLIHDGIGDAQVTTLGAQEMARAYGASTVAPQTRPIFGVNEQEGGFTGSAIVEWKYTDVGDEPYENVPPDEATDTHECPRREPAGQEQIRRFVDGGTIDQTCDGACTDVRANICG